MRAVKELQLNGMTKKEARVYRKLRARMFRYQKKYKISIADKLTLLLYKWGGRWVSEVI